MRTKSRRVSRMIVVLSCAALCLSVSSVAQAALITFSFEGTVVGASSSLNPPISPNTPIKGFYKFESTTPDLLPGNLVVGRYALSGFSVSLLGTVGKTYTMGPAGERTIEIVNSFSDAYRVSLARVELDQPQAIVGPSINDFAPRAFQFSIAGNDDLFTNDSLLLAPPSLGSAPFTMTFYRNGVGGLEAVQASGGLTSLTLAPVPLPGALLLFGSGLLGLMGISVGRRMMARPLRSERN